MKLLTVEALEIFQTRYDDCGSVALHFYGSCLNSCSPKLS